VRLTFLLYPGVEPIDLAAIGVISMASRVIPDLSYETVALGRDAVALANGLMVLPSRSTDEVDKVDVLLVPGGPGWRAASRNPQLLSFIRRIAHTGEVCSVCTGAMILAEAGLLDGLSATTKVEVVSPETSPLHELQTRYPKINSIEALVVDNGAVVTGGGVTLCIDATLYLLEKRFGRAASDEVARIMEYGAARAANSARLGLRFVAPAV